jgi:hypothetical protein
VQIGAAPQMGGPNAQTANLKLTFHLDHSAGGLISTPLIKARCKKKPRQEKKHLVLDATKFFRAANSKKLNENKMIRD